MASASIGATPSQPAEEQKATGRRNQDVDIISHAGLRGAPDHRHARDSGGKRRAQLQFHGFQAVTLSTNCHSLQPSNWQCQAREYNFSTTETVLRYAL